MSNVNLVFWFYLFLKGRNKIDIILIIISIIIITMEEKIERVRQYCLYFLDDTLDLSVDCTDEEFDIYFIKQIKITHKIGDSNHDKINKTN